MSDWIGLGVIILVVAGGFYALVRANDPRPPLTEEEFEKRAAEGHGFLGASVNALDKIINPAAERAEAVQQDFRQGFYGGEQESGDDNDTNPEENESDQRPEVRNQ